MTAPALIGGGWPIASGLFERSPDTISCRTPYHPAAGVSAASSHQRAQT